MATVNWSAKAASDLESIAEYIGRDSLQSAKSQVSMLIERTFVLEKYLEIGRTVPELPGSVYKQILAGRYRIIYKTRSNDVCIITGHHQSMLLSNNPIFKRKLKRKKK